VTRRKGVGRDQIPDFQKEKEVELGNRKGDFGRGRQIRDVGARTAQVGRVDGEGRGWGGGGSGGGGVGGRVGANGGGGR